VEPIESKITKENSEIQLYLKEFSPKDPLMIKDFEDAVQKYFSMVEDLPQRVFCASFFILSYIRSDNGR